MKYVGIFDNSSSNFSFKIDSPSNEITYSYAMFADLYQLIPNNFGKNDHDQFFPKILKFKKVYKKICNSFII